MPWLFIFEGFSSLILSITSWSPKWRYAARQCRRTASFIAEFGSSTRVWHEYRQGAWRNEVVAGWFRIRQPHEFLFFGIALSWCSVSNLCSLRVKPGLIPLSSASAATRTAIKIPAGAGGFGLVVKEAFQQFRAVRMAQFAQCFGFDLPDAFAGNIELTTNFFQGVVSIHVDAKAHA